MCVYIHILFLNTVMIASKSKHIHCVIAKIFYDNDIFLFVHNDILLTGTKSAYEYFCKHMLLVEMNLLISFYTVIGGLYSLLTT